MQVSSVSGVTTRRTITDIDLSTYNTLVDSHKSNAILTTKQNTSNIKTVSVSSARYTRLDSTMPAVAFVNFKTEAGGLFLTNTIPPKYIKNFTCTRVNNDVGKFTLDLQCPIDTFGAGSDDLNLKLINLFGHIDAATADDAGNATGFKCEISYGWRGSASDTVIRYSQAQILGMTLNYSGNYYTYSISGTLNNTSDAAHETGVKMLSAEALQSINTDKLSEASVETINVALGTDGTAVSALLSEANTGYRIKIPAGSKIYKIDSNKKVTPSAETVETDIYFIYSNTQNNTTSWTSDYLYCYNSPRGNYTSLDAYSVNEVILQKFTGSFTASAEANVDSVIQAAQGLNLSEVYAGERISTKVEILANYLFGDLYEVEVCHNDKEYTDDVTSIATLVESLNVKDVAPDDEPSYTINETTTSLYTWLLHMIRACQDTSQSDAYDKYKNYDYDGDGHISQGDLANVSSIDTQTIVDKWKKHGIDTYTYEQWDDSGDNKETVTGYAFSHREMSEDEFKKYYKDYSYLNGPYSNSYIISSQMPTAPSLLQYSQNTSSTPANIYSVSSLTYEDYQRDYKTYQASLNYTDDNAEIQELIDDFGGTIYKDTAAIQYQLHYLDAVAGKPGRIYIGPARTDAESHQYIVGNNAKDSTVISFSTSENMVYLISAVKSYVSAATSGLYKIDPNTGAIVTGNVDTSSAQIDTKYEYATNVANNILSTIAKGHIKAELKVISDVTSRKIQTTDNITILCQANGGKTMMSGTYYVAEVKDSIDENGTLTTTMSLQFTQSSAFETVKNIILQHLSNVTIN